MDWFQNARFRDKRRRGVPFLVPPAAAKGDDEAKALVKQAGELENIQKAVSDAASVGAPLWVSYIGLMFYICIAVGAVTHKDLLLENPVELPFLSIKLPLKAFFILAPIIFVIVHAYVLAHFAMLADKAKAFHRELQAKLPDAASGDLHEARERLRRQLPINIFVQFLAGPSYIRGGLFSLLLWAVAWVTLVAGPIATLLLLQLQFLPYHDTRVTWVHRGALIFDLLVVIWPLWMWILGARENGDAAPSFFMWVWGLFLMAARYVFAWPLTAAILVFSVLIATFPGEWKEIPFSYVVAVARDAPAACRGESDPLSAKD
jgi:hypothetical protein